MKTNNVVSAIDEILAWCVYIAVFALPFSKSAIEICAVAGLIMLLAKKIILKNFNLPRTAAGIPILFIIITSALSLINSQYMSLSLRALFSKMLKFALLYFLVVEAIDSRTKLMNLLKMAAISGVIIFVDAFTQYFLTHRDFLHSYPTFKFVNDYHFEKLDPVKSWLDYFIGYPTASFPYPNDLAAWLLIITPPALFLSLLDLKDKASRRLISLFSFIGIFIFVLTKARSAWLGFIIATGSLVFLLKKHVVILLAAIFILIALSFARAPGDIFSLTSTQDRSVMWSNSYAIFIRHPVIGNGLNTFFNNYMKTRQDEYRDRKGSYAHNCYLQMAADTGLVGLFSFLWFAAAILWSSISFIRRCRDLFYKALMIGLETGIAAFLIHSFFDTNLYSLNLAALFWMAAGLTASVIRIKDADIT